MCAPYVLGLLFALADDISRLGAAARTQRQEVFLKVAGCLGDQGGRQQALIVDG